MDPFVYIIPVFFIAIFLELYIGRRKSKKLYRLNDTITNLNIGIGNRVVSVLSKGMLLGIYLYFFNNFACFEISANPLTFFICLLGFDFLFYWAHRWGHEINFFWGAHIVHHQSEEYNLSVALRQSWIHDLIAFFIFLPMPILGFGPEIFFPAALFASLYQFWIHTKTIQKLPFLVELIMNTPAHHRVHHAVNLQYIDKNYAAVFIIWDRLFGTFAAEEEEPTYGITNPLKSWNPSWANTHYYYELYQKAKDFPNWKDKLQLLFAKPGWMPASHGGYEGPPDLVQAELEQYDEKPPVTLNVYVLVQFLFIVLGLVEFMNHFEELSLFYKIGFAVMIIFSIVICGGIIENKKWIEYAEYARLVLLLLGLNSCYYFWYLDWFNIMLWCSTIAFLTFITWFTISWQKSIKLTD